MEVFIVISVFVALLIFASIPSIRTFTLRILGIQVGLGKGQEKHTISGKIEVKSKTTDKVVGVHIKPSSSPTELKAGTSIKVETENTSETTGLKIGE